MPDPNNKALVASSEFDPSAFVKGIDEMTAALGKLSVKEDEISGELKKINTALTANRAEFKATQAQIDALDKTSKTYTDDLNKLIATQTRLKTEQKDLRATLVTNKEALREVNLSANQYKAALDGITAISKKVATENKGRTLFDIASLNQQVQEINQIGGKLRNVFQGKISTAELDKFEAALSETNDEFQQLGQVITFVKSKMDTLDPDSQEFADLNRVIETGEAVLEQYASTTERVEKTSGSLRGRLTALRTELVNLENQGKENTKEFQDLQIQAGRLQDSISDAAQRIKVLSSDTRNLDFGIGAIRGVASAFGVAEGAAALFGIKNEDVMQSIQRLNAIMLILNGLQEIQNILQKQSVVSIVGQSIATKAATIATRVYAITVGTATGAMKAFKIALLATGIGAIVVLLGLAAEAMGLFSDKTDEATDSNKLFNDELDRTNELLEGTVRNIKLQNQIDEERLKRSGAGDEKLNQNRIKGLETERAALRETYAKIRADQDTFLSQGLTGDFVEKANADATQIANRIRDIGDEITLDNEKQLTKRADDTKKSLDKQASLYEAYRERVLGLQRELRDKLLAAQPQDEAAIQQQFTNSLNDALEDLDREVKTGKLTAKRANVIRELLKQITTVDEGVATKEFQKEAEKAEEELANSLFDIRLRNGQERAELMREQFTREAAIVRIEARNQAAQLIREREEIIDSINLTRDQGLISPEAAIENIDRIEQIYEQLLENLAAQTSRKQEEITARTFQAAQEQLQTIFSNVQLIVSQAATEEILAASARFQGGQINYERYQKELSEIAERESRRRITTAIREQEALLQAVTQRIPQEQDPDRLKALQDQERQLRLTISDLQRQLAAVDAEGTSKDAEARNKRIQELASYAQAIGGIITQVVQFWQQVNQAEQESLERSIALQERRVEAAVRIAERGNSEYLRLEEDRLNELQVKQENAARRQLAINAILQTSQALVAFVTALAQGIATGGPLGGIAIAAAVIGAIAAGYAIISSLQSQNSQKLKKGTKSVKREGQPAGEDTVPAMLTEGEAVIPRETNRKYKPAIDAIYDQKIPAKEINNFVNNYRVNNRIFPKLDHEKMGEMAGIVVQYDTQLLQATKDQTRRIEENTEKLDRVERRLAAMGIEVNVDKNGLAISLMKATKQFAIDKRT